MNVRIAENAIVMVVEEKDVQIVVEKRNLKPENAGKNKKTIHFCVTFYPLKKGFCYAKAFLK
jgi:hypothetical protein